MNKLIVLAHPSSKGTARQLALAYQQGAKAKGHQVKFIDLYREPHQDFLNFESAKNLNTDQLEASYQNQIKWAQEISFFAPMWWLSFPAILKNFLDVNFSSGFAFRYTSSGRPLGLLKGRTARTFMTCDNSRFLYTILLIPHRLVWHLALGLCGIRHRHFNLFDHVRLRSQAEKDRWAEQVKQIK